MFITEMGGGIGCVCSTVDLRERGQPLYSGHDPNVPFTQKVRNCTAIIRNPILSRETRFHMMNLISMNDTFNTLIFS